MGKRIVPVALLPFCSGCIVVQDRRPIFDLGEFFAPGGPVTDAGLAGRLLVIAACSGLLGGVVAWLISRCRTARRAGTAIGS
jgi:hypothetical protein